MISRLRHADAAGLVPVIFAFLVLVPGLGWGLPTARDADSTFPWGYDEQAPLPPLGEAQLKFQRQEGKYLPYPLFHYIVLTASYLPYVGYEYLTGDFRPTSHFPYGMKHPAHTCAVLTLIARTVSLLMAMGCVWLTYRISRLVELERWRASGVAFATSLLPTFVYYGRVANVDVPYVFWSVAALHAAAGVLFAQRFGSGVFIRFGVFSALAVATKDQASGFLVAVPPLLLVALANGPYRAGPTRARYLAALAHRPLWIGLAASLLAFVLANNLIFGWDGFLAHIRVTLSMSKDDRKWDADLAGQWGLLTDAFDRLAWTVGPLLILSALGTVRLLWDRRYLVLAFLLLPIVAHHVLILSRILYCHPRFMLLPAILVLPLAAFGFRWNLSRLLLAVIGFAYLAFAAIDITRAQLEDARYDAARYFAGHAKPGQTVETYARFSRLVPELPAGVKLDLVPAADILTKWPTRKPDFILITDLSEHSVLIRPEYHAFLADLLAGRLGYRVVLERDTPSLLGRKFVRGLAPQVIVLQRESVP